MAGGNPNSIWDDELEARNNGSRAILAAGDCTHKQELIWSMARKGMR
jgi:hypothetical protein